MGADMETDQTMTAAPPLPKLTKKYGPTDVMDHYKNGLSGFHHIWVDGEEVANREQAIVGKLKELSKNIYRPNPMMAELLVTELIEELEASSHGK